MTPAPQANPPDKYQKLPRLSLRSRGVATLAVPMAALFVALFSIYSVEQDSADTEARAMRAYEEREKLRRIEVNLLDASRAAGEYLTSGSTSQGTALDDARRAVEQAVSQPPGNAVRQESQEVLDILSGIRKGGRPNAPPLTRLQTATDAVRAKLRLASEARAAEVAKASVQRETERRKVFRVIIVCGIVGPLGALFVHLLIAGRLARRLQAVEENARRLAHDLPLLPFPNSSDEIGAVARQIDNAAFLMQERERNLLQSESRYRDLFDRAPIAYEETDPEGVVRRFNLEVCNLLKCTPDRVLGRRAWDFLSSDQQEEFREAMMRRIATGEESGPMECDYLLEDGSHIAVEIRESLIRNEDGVVTGVCRSLLDVTERNLAAVAARKVGQYASELRLKNEQLARALEAARSATEAKSRFLASMSHELRTPLNGIIGFSELMHDGKLGPVTEDQRDIMADILTSARHLLGLIGDILDLSKVEAGKMEFRLELSPVDRLVYEVRDIVSTMAQQKHQELIARVPEGLQAVIDPARFKQVVLNFLSNAVKFTPPGGSVRVRVELTEASRLRVEVEDTGIGIAPEDMPLLFNEFRQLPNNRKPDQGSGLGLALTRHIVEAQGGTVTARSILGKGSIFTAELPVGPQTT